MSEAAEQILKKAHSLHEEGRLADAVLLYKKITARQPANVEALYGWACVAYDRGNLKNAEKLLKRALESRPGYPPALSKLGAVYVRYGWYGWAKDCFRKALGFDDCYMPAYNNLAMALAGIGEPWEAEEICREGLAKDSAYAPLHTVLGQALRVQGKTQEAIEEFEQAIKLAGSAAPLDLCNMGSVYADMGDKRKARQYFKKAMKADPDLVEAHYLFSRIHKYKLDDPHIKIMEALLKKTSKDSYEAIRLSFSLGKAYDDAGEFDKAFTCYAQGNYLMRSTFKYTTKSTEQNFTGIKKVFKGNFKKLEIAPRKSDFTPIFIVGMPRSGTTLTEQILYSHPQVEAGGETVYLDQLQGKYNFVNFKEGGWDISKMSGEDLLHMRNEYLEKLERHAPGAKYITDKMPINFRFIGLIRLLFPQAKVIHCRRDAMDSCFSIYKCMFTGFFPFSYDLKELGQYHKSYEDLMAFWHKKLSGFIHDVQYEDLVADQEKVTKGILSFCGLPWDPACLDFYKKERSIMTASALQVKKPLYKGAIGRWREYDKHLILLKKELA